MKALLQHLDPRHLMLASLAMSAQVWAQPMPTTVPSAGSLLSEDMNTSPPPIRPQSPVHVEPPDPALPSTGDVRVMVHRLELEGLDAEEIPALLLMLGPVQGTHDFASMRRIAEQVTELMRSRGHPFAQAYLPPQSLENGVLRVAVLPGRWGTVVATGDPTLAIPAQAWLSGLRPGALIVGADLDRSLLLLDDLPGVDLQATLRPGQEIGSGDLAVALTEANRWTGEVGINNHGNRYAGREKLFANASASHWLTLGDQISASVAGNDQRTWQSALSYGAPLGTMGWRGQVGWSQSNYTLGKEFSELQAHGKADVFSTSLAYPLIRTETQNLRMQVGLQLKRLRDEQDATESRWSKTLHSVPFTISGDWQGDTGVTWGQITFTRGDLKLDQALTDWDSTTAQSAGSFSKINLDLMRLEHLSSRWSLYARLSGQWASKNLDASEKLVLGGPYAVRGWASGQAAGDQGWLLQLEMRHTIVLPSQRIEPYVFVDGGQIKINRKPWDDGTRSASVSAAGVGIRWSLGHAYLDTAWGKRHPGNTGLSNSTESSHQAWITLGWRWP